VAVKLSLGVDMVAARCQPPETGWTMAEGLAVGWADAVAPGDGDAGGGERAFAGDCAGVTVGGRRGAPVGVTSEPVRGKVVPHATRNSAKTMAARLTARYNEGSDRTVSCWASSRGVLCPSYAACTGGGSRLSRAVSIHRVEVPLALNAFERG